MSSHPSRQPVVPGHEAPRAGLIFKPIVHAA
jgi:hypothetical protein